MTVIAQLDLPVFADYFQFYLQDEIANEDFGALWTEAAVERLIAVAESSVGIGTARNMSVPVSVTVLADEPPADFDEWEMVNECSLLLRSGRLALLGCTDTLADAPRLELAPGSWRIRVSYSGLDSLRDDGLDGDDFYRVQIWAAPPGPLLVLKERVLAA